MPDSLDKPLFYTVAALLAIGFVVLASASMVLSQKIYGSSGYFILRQILLGGVIGTILLVVFYKINYRFWKKIAVPLMIFSFLLLALLFIPSLSLSFGGARRWLALGFLSFQPSEVLKFSFIVYLAGWLESRKADVSTLAQGMVPFALMLSAVSIFLIMQPDIGTLGVIAITAVALYFLGGGRKSQITSLIVLGLIIFYFVVQLAPYRMNRITTFLDPGEDPTGIGYQINQAFIAIGSGGFWGRGIGKSLQKFQYLPEPMGDSVFAIFAEETGFFGAVILIGLFCLFLWRGFAVARRSPDIFGKLLACGITLGISIQAFVNMAAISGLMPLTGIPLPFVSYGGTALMMTLAQIGVLLNIAKNT